MNCRELEIAVEQDGLEPLPAAARTHLADCSACRNLLADFSAIVGAARDLPVEAEPPQRLWLALRSQLVAEGMIREAGTGSWWDSIASYLRTSSLVTAAVGFLLVLAAALELYQPAAPPTPMPPAFAETAAVLDNQEKGVAQIVRARAANSPVDASLNDNLQIVNKFIADCELRVRQEPGDDVAREYLSGAYQQKAELLSAMMERAGGGD
jgi:hypothetical protein